MSEVLTVRDSDQVMRELAQTKAAVIEAQRVLIVGAGALPKLLGELNDSLADLGYVCVPIEPAQGLYKTFADLLECPSLAPLLQPQEVPPTVTAAPEPQSLAEEANDIEREIRALEDSLAIPVSRDVTEFAVVNPSPAVADVSKLDMTKPINWKLGDVFQDNPRITLPHKRRKWILDMLDVSDWATLTGIDVQIRSPNTSTTELWSLTSFMARYVFLERPVAEQSAAE